MIGAEKGGSSLSTANTISSSEIDSAVWHLARALAGAVIPNDVALAVAEHGAAAAGATFSNMALFDGSTGRVRAVHGSNLEVSIASRWSELDLADNTPLGDAIVDMEPVLLPSLEVIRARYPGLVDDTLVAGLVATASLPLRRAGGATLGAVGFGWSEVQAFGPEQRLSLSLIAELTAQALDRSLLHAELVESVSRIRLLQRLTEHFASATTARDIADIAMVEVVPMVGASIVLVTRVDGEWIDHIADTRLPDRLGEITRRPFSDRVPSTDAARTGRRVVFPTHADRKTAYGDTPWLEDLADFGPVVAFPAIVNDAVVGTLALVFPLGVELSEDDLTFLATICDQCGQALERVRLLEERGAYAFQQRQVARELGQNLDRIQALQRVTSKLATATTTEMICRAVVDEGITMIGDFGGVCVADPEDDQRVIGWFTPGFSKELGGEFSLPLDTSMGLITAFRTDNLVVARTLDEAIALSPANTAAHREHQSQGILGVPAHANGLPVGAIGMGFTSEGAVTDEIVAISATLADLMGQAIYRASLYERSHQAAHSLQISLLPRLPEVPGFDIAARYAPGGAVGGDGEVVVGGDWYEVIDLGKGRVGIVIGDVMGRGINAAAVMGQLRALARGYAELDLPPGRVLELLDTQLGSITDGRIATCLFAVYERDERTLAVATAGHPMPVIMAPGCPPTSLVGPIGPPLGTKSRPYRDHAVKIPAGSLLALFTDGLIETRDLGIDEGVTHLSECLALFRDLPLPQLADQALADMARIRVPDDDTALLLVRVP